MNVDVLVIGSGQAGVPLAVRLAGDGKKVMVVERGALGGTCINTGCTPTKTMIASARAAHVARTSGRLGVRTTGVEVDLAAVVDRKEAIVRQWVESIEKKLTGAGPRLVVVRGHARFVGTREIEVAGERHRADTVVINVGARPVTPPVPGLADVPWLDNARLMELRQVPDHLIILGGGYVGCELGQAFRRFGAKVTFIDRNAHLLAREDEDVSSALEAAFQSEGITLELGRKVEAIARSGQGVVVTLDGDRKVEGSHLLVATGRRPNTDDLGCDAAGIRLDDRGFVVIDDQFRTSVPGVYAVGDAAGLPQFTHVSWDDHRLLLEVLAGRPARGAHARLVPYTVFTDPQLGAVGMTEREARERGLEFEVAALPFGHIARAIEVDETAGIVKVLIDAKTERVLGARILGAEGGELIHIFAALMEAKAPARTLVEMQVVHPTFAEGVQSVLMKLGRFSRAR